MENFNNAKKKETITFASTKYKPQKSQNNKESDSPQGGTILCSVQDVSQPSHEGTSQLSSKGLDWE